MYWTDERVEVTKKLWAEGLSASQIAKELGGVTRNAVIGKVHRLGLSGRAAPARPPSRIVVRRKPVQMAKRGVPSMPRLRAAALAVDLSQPTLYIEPAQIDGRFVTLATLGESICKWPIGTPGDVRFQFCGRKTVCKEPYCEAHKRMAYNPPKKRRTGTAGSVERDLDAIAATNRMSW